MNREQLIRNMKLEMKRWIEQMDENNYEDIQQKLTSYFQMIETMKALPAPPPVKQKKKKVVAPIIEEETVVENHELPVHNEPDDRKGKKVRKEMSEPDRLAYEEKMKAFYEETQTDTLEPIIEVAVEKVEELEQKTNTEKEVPVSYVFERKLRGGMLAGLDAFVPEGIIRRLNLEHGDLVSATLMSDYGGRKKYNYEVVEAKGQGDAPDRKQMNYCLVEKEAGYLVVKRSSTTNESIRFNGVPYSLVLQDGDVQHFGVKEGDLIDVAYKESNPGDNRILWIHESELPVVETKKPLAQKSVNEQKDETEEPEQTLIGADVLVVGNEGSRKQYQTQVEKRGGNFIWLDPEIQPERFAPLVRKSSFVIFLTGKNGHTPMKQLKQLCKNYNKPFEATFNDGVSSVIRTAEELAEKCGCEMKKESV